MGTNVSKRWNAVLFAGLLAGGIAVSGAAGQAAHAKELPGANPPPVTSASVSTPSATSTNSGNRDTYLRRTWGVDDLEIRIISSGELLRFSYRVLDAGKATPLNDKKSQPHLVDESSGYMLQIPEMENVGQLRQTAPPENGRQYWMVFSNKGRLVKPGNRVAIVIGKFRVDDLMVEQAPSMAMKQGGIR